ncbi:hypothetical protein [Breoghania sp.]|uniref:hypothetical protein n=1 Tax=Breoghania sp. TaxID=2065378 RepID=UPI00262DB181|nr:hypothetical protein [Breoghania sp.]MDJ0933547.1 hypothetical protein [Breoghania sp.]
MLPLIRDPFEGISSDFYQGVDRGHCSLRRDLMVPFDPPMIYGVGGRLYFPWFSFWRSNSLADERLALFVTVVEELLADDPDLEMARFEVLDFSCSDKNSPRELRVINTGYIPRVDADRKAEMISCFSEGYFLACKELSSSADAAKSEKRPGDDADSDQLGLFD